MRSLTSWKRSSRSSVSFSISNAEAIAVEPRALLFLEMWGWGIGNRDEYEDPILGEGGEGDVLVPTRILDSYFFEKP